MFISNAKYIKVWEVEEKNDKVIGNLSESEKNQDGSYNNWYWKGKFVGDCKDKGRALQGGELIEILKGKVRKFKYNDKWYDELVIFDFQIMEQGQQVLSDDEEQEEILPF